MTASNADAGLNGLPVIALEALFAGPICGASMNPARSLAPALVSLRLDSLWIYLVAPVLGAVIGLVAGLVGAGGAFISVQIGRAHV